MDVRRVLNQPYWAIMTQEEKKKALLIEKLGDLDTSAEHIAVLREIVKSADMLSDSLPLIDAYMEENGIDWAMKNQ